MFVIPEAGHQGAIIKVVGVGGGGGNAVTHMVNSGIEGVDFVCVNTDAQALKHARVKTSIQIGSNITQGPRAGATPAARALKHARVKPSIQISTKWTKGLFTGAGWLWWR